MVIHTCNLNYLRSGYTRIKAQSHPRQKVRGDPISKQQAGHWWHWPEIPTIEEAEVRRSQSKTS
jgi:hypothetical protein